VVTSTNGIALLPQPVAGNKLGAPAAGWALAPAAKVPLTQARISGEGNAGVLAFAGARQLK
jgi:hypothetical protein